MRHGPERTWHCVSSLMPINTAVRLMWTGWQLFGGRGRESGGWGTCRGGRKEKENTELEKDGRREAGGRRSARYNWTILSLGSRHTHYITERSHIIHPVNGLYLEKHRIAHVHAHRRACDPQCSDTIVGLGGFERLVSVCHSVCAACRLNALRDHEALCGRPVLPLMWSGDRERETERGREGGCSAEQLRWKQSHPAEVFLSRRRRMGDGGENEEQKEGDV